MATDIQALKDSIDMREMVLTMGVTESDRGSGYIHGNCPKGCDSKNNLQVYKDTALCYSCHADAMDAIAFVEWLDDTDFKGALGILDPDGKFSTNGNSHNGNGHTPKRSQGATKAQPGRPEKPKQPAQPQSVESYAASHGLTAGDLAVAGWILGQYEDHANVNNEWETRKRPGLKYKTSTGERIRFLDYSEESKVWSKYKWVKGTGTLKPGWYGLDKAIKLANETGQDLTLCNGEISTMAAQSVGWAACCITSGEKPSYSQHLIDELKDKWQGMVWIAFDCDLAGTTQGPKLETNLLKAGIQACNIDLGFDYTEKSGKDVADFVDTWGKGSVVAFGTLINTPQTPQNDTQEVLEEIETNDTQQAFTTLGWGDVLSYPDKNYYVDQLFGPGDVCWLVGDAGTGKTFVMIDLLMACITSSMWAGRYSVVEHLRVLYMTDEGLSSFMGRLVAAGKQYSIPYDEDAQKRLMVTTDMLNIFDDTKDGVEDGEPVKSGYNKFVEQFYDFNPQLIIIDTLSNAAVGSDENSNRDAKIIGRNIKRLIRDMGGDQAIFLTHHVSKGHGNYRGASAFKGDIDLMLQLTADKDCEDSFYMTNPKNKHDREGPCIVGKRVKSEGEYYPVLEWSQYVEKQKEMKAKKNEGDFDKVLRLFDKTTEAKQTELIDAIAKPRSSAIRILDKMLEAGLIDKRKPNPDKSATGQNQWLFSKVNND